MYMYNPPKQTHTHTHFLGGKDLENATYLSKLKKTELYEYCNPEIFLITNYWIK